MQQLQKKKKKKKEKLKGTKVHQKPKLYFEIRFIVTLFAAVYRREEAGEDANELCKIQVSIKSDFYVETLLASSGTYCQQLVPHN